MLQTPDPAGNRKDNKDTPGSRGSEFAGTGGLLGRCLSPTGTKITVLSLICVGIPLLTWQMITESGLAGLLMRAQASIFGGLHSRHVTMLLGILILMIPAAGLGFMYDLITGRGLFAPRCGQMPDGR